MKWRDAQDLVGLKRGDDYVLDLDGHAERFRDTAPGLAALMQTAAARSAAEAYARFDAAAISAQSAYRRAMRFTNLGALLTSVLGSAAMAMTILATQSSHPRPYEIATTVLSTSAALAAATGAAGLYWLRHGRLLESWMSKRATAETHRIGYFSGLLSQAASGTRETALLGLEYFRRYHFEVQKDYYHLRARHHERSANVTLAIGAAGAFLATIASSMGVAADGVERAVSAIGVCGAAIGAYAIGREQMTQDRRNAERYDRTYSALMAITGQLDAVRVAAEAGQAEAVGAFGAAVNEQVSNEHRQWLDGQEAAREALARIEKALTPPEAAAGSPAE